MTPHEHETLEDVHRIARKAEGWLTFAEGALLYRLAERCTGKGIIVEIGSWKGRSTIYLAKGAQKQSKSPIYAVDPHIGSSEHQQDGAINTFEEFKANIANAKVKDFVIPLVKPSAEAADECTEPVELIFIDGAHEYEYVREDLEKWLPHLMDGARVAFHDSTWEGPKQLLREQVYRSGNFQGIWMTDSITVAVYHKRFSLRNRLFNFLNLGIFNLRMLAGKIRPQRAA